MGKYVSLYQEIKRRRKEGGELSSTRFSLEQLAPKFRFDNRYSVKQKSIDLQL